MFTEMTLTNDLNHGKIAFNYAAASYISHYPVGMAVGKVPNRHTKSYSYPLGKN